MPYKNKITTGAFLVSEPKKREEVAVSGDTISRDPILQSVEDVKKMFS